jgi:hypothetical protein
MSDIINAGFGLLAAATIYTEVAFPSDSAPAELQNNLESNDLGLPEWAEPQHELNWSYDGDSLDAHYIGYYNENFH